MSTRGEWIVRATCALLLLAGPVVGHTVEIATHNENNTQRQVLPISGENEEQTSRQVMAPIQGMPILLLYVELVALEDAELRAAIQKEVAELDTQLLDKDLDEEERSQLLRQKVLLLSNGSEVRI